MLVVLVEVNIACLTRRKVTPVDVASNRRVPMVYGDVVRNRVVTRVDLVANGATEKPVSFRKGRHEQLCLMMTLLVPANKMIKLVISRTFSYALEPILSKSFWYADPVNVSGFASSPCANIPKALAGVLYVLLIPTPSVFVIRRNRNCVL